MPSPKAVVHIVGCLLLITVTINFLRETSRVHRISHDSVHAEKVLPLTSKQTTQRTIKETTQAAIPKASTVAKPKIQTAITPTSSSSAYYSPCDGHTPTFSFTVSSNKTTNRTFFQESSNIISDSDSSIQLPYSMCTNMSVSELVMTDEEKGAIPRAELHDFAIGMATLPSRLIKMMPVISHWLAPSSRQNHNVVLGNKNALLLISTADKIPNPEEETRLKGLIQEDAKNRGMNIEFQQVSIDRYEKRVVFLIASLYKTAPATTKWFIIQDDDTFWTTQEALLDFVRKYPDPLTNSLFIGALSEVQAQIVGFGQIAFGGGGILLSRHLMEIMNRDGALEECYDKFQSVFGGDGIITKCIDYVAKVSPIFDERLHQLDFRKNTKNSANAVGFFLLGEPVATLHHWNEWLTIFPETHDMYHANGVASIMLIARVCKAIGSINFGRRFSMDNGKVVVTLGYSVVVYKTPITAEELEMVEVTMNEMWRPIRPVRGYLQEGVDKVSYYIDYVTELPFHTRKVVRMAYRNAKMEYLFVDWIIQ